MAAISIQITDTATPGLREMTAALKNRRPMMRLIGNRVKTRVRDHLIARSQTVRNKLGAPSSGFWGQAAEKVARTAPVAGQDSVSLSLNHPGVARAFGPVTIRPLTGVYLTIPRIAEAYNRRAYRVKGLFFVKTKKGRAFLAESTGGGRGVKAKLKIWYSLVPVVHQKQDRTILPSDAQLESAALQGVEDYLGLILQRHGGTR